MTTPQPPTHYLLSISIGPVQEFIAASRKARDLWYGSDLLSALARTAANSLNAQQGVQLIFPAEAMLEDDNASVANKLLATIDPGLDPAQFAREARAAAQAELARRWQAAKAQRRDAIQQAIANVVDEDRLADQLTDFVEWYAAWLPFDPNAQAGEETSYSVQRKQVERLLAGRKAVREFVAARGVEGTPKSSLDPSRETVICKEAFEALEESIRRAFRLKVNEQLDGISLIKRLGGENRLPSVSRVAVDPLLRAAPPHIVGSLAGWASGLADTEFSERIDTGKNPSLANYAPFPYDCQLFYDPNAESAAVQATDDLSDDEQIALMCFFEDLETLKHSGEPPAYMAVLVADGDKMGEAIGTRTTPGEHITFSEKLVGFADLARRTVKDHFGVTIYAGGDDVLAFLPLDTALLCAHALKDNFKSTMEAALPELPELPAERKLPTLSVGVAIGHYSDHLQVLLERGRDAEREAKKRRNSLAVSFTARSNSTHIVSHSWSDGNGPIADRWWPAIDALRRDAIPDGAVYELGKLCDELEQMHAWFESTTTENSEPDGPRDELDPTSAIPAKKFPDHFVANEVRRILDRKRTNRGARLIHQKVRDTLNTRMTSPDAKDQIAVLREFVNELFIARKIEPVVRMTLDDTVLAEWELAGADLHWLVVTDADAVADVTPEEIAS